MRNEILRKIPEFDYIKDAELKEKVLTVWEEALSLGGFSVADLQRIPFTLLAENVSISFLEHVRTVCKMCRAMAEILIGMYKERVTINLDHLVAGALLADIGKMIEYQKKKNGNVIKGRKGELLRHPFSGVGLCFKAGIPYEVMHIIAVHSREGDHVKRSPEAIIFHHADFTDFELVR